MPRDEMSTTKNYTSFYVNCFNPGIDTIFQGVWNKLNYSTAQVNHTQLITSFQVD